MTINLAHPVLLEACSDAANVRLHMHTIRQAIVASAQTSQIFQTISQQPLPSNTHSTEEDDRKGIQ